MKNKGTLTGNKIIAFILLIIIIGLSYSGYKFYNYQRKKHLREAEVYFNIGKYKEAEEKLIKHLLKYPHDLNAKFTLAYCFEKQNKLRESIKIYKQILLQTKKQDLRTKVYRHLRSAYGDLALKLEKEASKQMEAKNFKEARKLFEQQLDCLLEATRYALENACAPKYRHIFFLALPEKYSISETLANIALTYWLEGNIEEARAALRGESPQILISALAKAVAQTDKENKEVEELLNSVKKYKLVTFADKLVQLAGKKFNKKDYKTARLYYEESLKAYTESGAKKMVPVIRYNVAITYYNEGKYLKAKEIAEKIKKDFPSYKPKKIDNFITKCQKAIVAKRKVNLMNLSLKACKEAEKAFNRGDYFEAIDHFRRAIDYAFKSGLEKSDSKYIAEIYYNIGISYYNAFEYKEALQHFLKIKSNFPSYYHENKTKIDMLIKRCRHYVY